MISPSKTRSEETVMTSKLGVDYHVGVRRSYVGSYPRGGLVRRSTKRYAYAGNAFPKPPRPATNDPLGPLDWYNVDTHSRYAQYLDTEPL